MAVLYWTQDCPPSVCPIVLCHTCVIPLASKTVFIGKFSLLQVILRSDHHQRVLRDTVVLVLVVVVSKQKMKESHFLDVCPSNPHHNHNDQSFSRKFRHSTAKPLSKEIEWMNEWMNINWMNQSINHLKSLRKHHHHHPSSQSSPITHHHPSSSSTPIITHHHHQQSSS